MTILVVSHDSNEAGDEHSHVHAQTFHPAHVVEGSVVDIVLPPGNYRIVRHRLDPLAVTEPLAQAPRPHRPGIIADPNSLDPRAPLQYPA